MRRVLLSGGAGALLLWAGLACARSGAIPGGPPDIVAPIVVATEPEPFATVPGFRGPVVIRFNERISERAAGGGLSDAVVVSPEGGEVRVGHRRDALEIEVAGGFRPGRVYRISVEPQVQDLFSNVLREPFEFFFSTGPDFEPAVVAGFVSDRITGNPVAARVDALLEGDSLAVVSRADSEGLYALRYLTPGRYTLTAYDDRNRNGRADFQEPQVVTRVLINTAADTVLLSLNVLQPDTSAATLVSAEVVDSTTLRFQFDDYLDPLESLAAVLISLETEAGDPPSVLRILHGHEYDSLRAASGAAGPVSVLGDPVRRTVAPPIRGGGAAQAPRLGPSSGAAELRPGQLIYALLGAPLDVGVAYEAILRGVENIAGVPQGGGTVTISRQPPPAVPDSAETEATVPDSPVIDTLLGDTIARDTFAAFRRGRRP